MTFIDSHQSISTDLDAMDFNQRTNRFVCIVWAAAIFTTTSSAQPAEVVTQLKSHLEKHGIDQKLINADFADAPLTREESAKARSLIWEAYAKSIRDQRKAEYDGRKVTLGKHTMPFFIRMFGKKPKRGWSVFISMHGGGGTAARVNDQQWEYQKRLYQLEEGIYLVPRAPTNAWNLWHQGHIDALFDRLITNLVVFEGANPNRVYLMGYSAGGDGVYQLAPRMADRLAAAAMMAGHPNEASPLGLRNIGFTIHMGERDSAYNRNRIAGEWQKRLEALKKADAAGYRHLVKIHANKGHWMDRQDAVAVPWMAKFTRTPMPDRVVWRQDDVTHTRFYWLAVSPENAKRGAEITAQKAEQEIRIEKCSVPKVTLMLNDRLVDLDKDVSVRIQDKEIFKGKVQRSIRRVAETTISRGDPEMVFSAAIDLEVP